MTNLLCVLLLLIHGELDERIAKVTQQIQEDPENTALYFERAELYFQHEDYLSSKGDLHKVIESAFESPDLDFLMARMLHALSQQDSALMYINQYFDDPTRISHVEAILLKADILFGSGEYLQAARCYENSISLNSTPSPEHYIKAAKAYLQYNGQDESAQAIQVLQSGKEQLGSLYVFDKLLIQIYMLHEEYDPAIELVSQIIDRSQRKTQYYVQRANLYQRKGDMTKAVNDLDLAIMDIENLPGFIRNNKMTSQLLVQIAEMKNQWK